MSAKVDPAAQMTRADDRDRRIVAKAGPWRTHDNGDELILIASLLEHDGDFIVGHEAAIEALCRIANRITRAEEEAMTALLLALTVTRHVVNGSICAFVSGIDPQAFAIQVRPVAGGSIAAYNFQPGTESFCVPLTVQRESIGWFEARQCYPVPCNPQPDQVCGDCEVSWYREPKLSCADPAGTGCSSLMYQVGP